MRLNCFIPQNIPKIFSEILIDLQRHIHIDALGNVQTQTSVSFTSFREINPESIPWKDLNSNDLNLYFIDLNDLNSEWIFQISQMSPGLIILISSHSRYLPTAPEDFEKYRIQILKNYGLSAVEAFDTNPNSTLQSFPLPLFRIQKALGLVTSSQTLKETFTTSVPYPIYYLPSIEETIEKEWIQFSKGLSTFEKLNQTQKLQIYSIQLIEICRNLTILRSKALAAETAQNLSRFFNQTTPEKFGYVNWNDFNRLGTEF